MIKLEKVSVSGLEHAIRGARNPMNSWDKIDSYYTHVTDCESGRTINSEFFIGEADLKLLMNLARGGSDHAKYRRMIVVYMDITAPLYWWKEFDTYKVGTTANSCSTMHKIHDRMLTMDDFSCEHLLPKSKFALGETIGAINKARELFIETNDKDYWWQMIQLLPTSYNQKRTVMLNYEVLAKMYKERKTHKLDEWVAFCKYIEQLPYSELITGGK